MRGFSFGRHFSALAIAIALLDFGGQTIRAQTATPSLPANWKQLSPTDFATLVRQYFDQGTFSSLNAADQEALAARGAALFSQIDIARTSLSYETMEMLQSVGQTKLDRWDLFSKSYEVFLDRLGLRSPLGAKVAE